jgi:hypothetical protein
MDAYGDLTETDITKKFPHGQEDNQSGRPLHDYDSSNPLAGLVSGTKTNFGTVFLQRLANPAKVYDPETNPYITVDWSPIDLTVFNGEDNVRNHALPSGMTSPWTPITRHRRTSASGHGSEARGASRAPRRRCGRLCPILPWRRV